METKNDLSKKWAVRAEIVREQEMKTAASWYNPWLHLAITAGVTSAAAVYGLLQLENVQALEWLTIPATFLFANLFEWNVHRHILHHKLPGLTQLYEKHTPMHHRVFTPDDMVIRSALEMRLVMVPALGIAGIVVLLLALTPLLALIISSNTAYLFLATATSYAALYEITHLLYHLDPDSFLGRLPGIPFLRKHHTLHHDPRIMQRWNFNVTIPLFDYLYRTATSDAEDAAARDLEYRRSKNA